MRLLSIALAFVLMVSPTLVEAKKLKPKYYKSCYADYNAMRKAVPKPPVDVAKTAKTASKVAGLAGRFGGFGGGLGSAVTTANTVAKYSDTIADVAEFTKSMSTAFPNASDRYLAYGDRMKTEAVDMQKVADFAMSSQECYANAYTELATASNAGSMKAKEVKKRHKEINTGVANVSELLSHATQYMDTNISAYDQAMNQETTGAGLNLDNLLSLATQAQSVSTQVGGLTGGGDSAQMGGRWAGWTTEEVRIESHRRAMAAHYGAAGAQSPYDAPQTGGAGVLGGFGSLAGLASLGSMDPGMAAQLALNQGVTNANLAAAGHSAAETQPAAQAAVQSDGRIEALMKAGGDVQPYLEAYNRIKALNGMQQGVAGYVSNKP